MDRMFFALSLGLAGFLLAAQSLKAQENPPRCAPRAVILDQLAQTYGESRKAIGLAGQTAMMELFASDQTGSWTMTVTMPDGRTCLVAAGQGFEMSIDPLPAKGEPA